MAGPNPFSPEPDNDNPATGGDSSWLPGNPLPWQLPADPLDDVLRGVIQTFFGRPYDPKALLNMLGKHMQGQTLPPDDLIDMVEMGIYFSRNYLGWKAAADNLEHYLVAGLQGNPDQFLPAALFENNDKLLDNICDKHWDGIIEKGIRNRVLSNPQTDKFPAKKDIARGPNGAPDIQIIPSPSPLPNGGTEVLYYTKSITPSTERDDVYNAVGTMAFVSEVTVRSVRNEEPDGYVTWDINIDKYRVWAWDDYDWFNKEKVGVTIPIDLLSKMTPGVAFAVEQALVQGGYDPKILKELKIDDTTFQAIDNKPIQHASGKSYHPKAFRIFVAPFDFDITTCLDGNSYQLTNRPE